MAETIRQAVVIVHGMGEQRPLETLNQFIEVGLPPDGEGRRKFYSRPDRVTESYESRRYLAPPAAAADGTELYAHTEFYEYHWAHLMQGNRFADIWPAFRKLLLRWPWSVPAGLRVVWFLVWTAIAVAAWLLFIGPWRGFAFGGKSPDEIVTTVLGGGLVSVVAAWFVLQAFRRWIASSFVDVVRYLDTSPRSYAVRRDIRAGIIALLEDLEATGRYQRIIVVAHSLGTYIAYDAITYLWGRLNPLRPGPPGDPQGGSVPDGLCELEQAASKLDASPASLDVFRDAQRRLWHGLRKDGSRWLITDFISLGSPMYFADQLYTRNSAEFCDRVEKRELPTCPPQAEMEPRNNICNQRLFYSWNNGGRRVLYHGAPFAVVRWTNLFFPPWLWFFGDWFGGRLTPLFGRGIVDIALRGNRLWGRIPGWAHTRYFAFPNNTQPDSVTTLVREAMDLASTRWLKDPPDVAPASASPDAS